MVLFNLTLSNGEPVPMASTAQDSEGAFVGDVVQGACFSLINLPGQKAS
ncbi:TPA: hypothetical protein ACPQJZ_000656 [Haemophilus influenzae]